MRALQSRILLTAAVVLLALGGCQHQPETHTPATDAGCLVEPPPEPVACTMEWNPVCGCDDRTYGNACQARAAGVARHTPGECDPSKLQR